MLRVARAITSSGAEDVVQETWAAVIDGLSRFEERSSLKTWIFRILSNRANSWLRAAKRHELASLASEELALEQPALAPERFSRMGNWSTPPTAWLERSPEELILHMERGVAIARLVEALPPVQRVVVTLKDVEGLSTAEVCEIVGVSEANLRVLLHRGRSTLRTEMERSMKRGRS